MGAPVPYEVILARRTDATLEKEHPRLFGSPPLQRGLRTLSAAFLQAPLLKF